VSAVYLTHARRTLYESKGLEFNDVSPTLLHICLVTDKAKVLLYNFFGDSTATLNQWRLVLNGDSGGDSLSDAPVFDETRHASICVEVRHLRPKFFNPPPSYYPGPQLKFLYVAITRARKNLWIMDSSESAGPMKVPENPIPQKTPLTPCAGILE